MEGVALLIPRLKMIFLVMMIKEPEKKKYDYKRNDNEPADWFFPNLLGQYKKLGKGEEQYDAAGNGYKVNIPYQKGWKFEDYRNAAYNQAWDNYKKSWEGRYSDEQIVEMVQASQMLNYNRQKREKQEAYDQEHAGENRQKFTIPTRHLRGNWKRGVRWELGLQERR